MSTLTFLRFSVPFCALFLFASCDQESKNQTKETKPEVFTPTTPENDTKADTAGIANKKTQENKSPVTALQKLPSRVELKNITPNQEAKRALTNDARKAAEMSLPEFGDFMKSRIPYYQGKGELKFENDIVKIHITNTEMRLQTPKGMLTFPMQ
jgi:hypothetical protein